MREEEEGGGGGGGSFGAALRRREMEMGSVGRISESFECVVYV